VCARSRGRRRTLSCIVEKTSDELCLLPADFDRYLEEHGIPEEHYPAAFALWIAEWTGGLVPRFENVEQPDEA